MAENAESTPRILYLIDGHAQIFRAYHAIRGGMNSPVTQEPTNATFGFVGMLLKLWREHKPEYVVVTIDVSGDTETFRREIDPQYKANRDAPPEDLAPQVERIVEICNLMGIPVIGVEGVEADDVIATVCRRLAGEALQVRIVSKDKDLHQLLGPDVSMFDIHTDTHLDVDGLKEEKSISPEQVVDVLALMGDTVDNIPGVPGVGAKTAAKLIAKYGSIENLLEHTEELTPKQRENVEASGERVLLNRKLVKLRDDVPFDFDLEQARFSPEQIEQLLAAFEQLGFNQHREQLRQLSGYAGDAASADKTDQTDVASKVESHGDGPGLFDSADTGEATAVTGTATLPQTGGFDVQCIRTREELDELVATLRREADAGRLISVDTETDSLHVREATLCGLSFAWSGDGGVYVPIRSPQPNDHLDEATVMEALRPVLEDASVGKMGQNLKYDISILRSAGVRLAGVKFDTLIASFLIDAGRSSHSLDNLALAYLNYRMIPIRDLIGTGRKQITFDKVPLDQAAPYAAEDAMVVVRLHERLAPQLKPMGLVDLFDQLEMPLVEVLAELEYNGIEVDPAELDRQRDAMAGRIDELRRSVLDTAGIDFNPDSPKQLANVLFNELGCTVVKRRKTGPSTDSEVLTRIANEQSPPGSTVAEMVLEYRQLTKLRGTYLEALKEAISEKTGRIHASFNQTGASTGRLSSHDPNLQNIPIRTDMGRAIRKAFVAPDGHVLMGADYSQIELRLLAHLSGDPGLTAAFEKDLDIHAAVAAEVFGVAVDEVTSEQRGVAKMVNFGIVYGITPFGLARRLRGDAQGAGDVDQARQIIEDYKRRYPKIDAFLARCVEQAMERGYVRTIMQRRRPIPQAQSRRGNLAQLSQRMAINSVVQGSAADLIKQAMVDLHRKITDESRPLRMLLQIHDELVFEVPADQVAEQATFVREQMVGAMELSVPLKVDISWGPNWFEAK